MFLSGQSIDDCRCSGISRKSRKDMRLVPKWPVAHSESIVTRRKDLTIGRPQIKVIAIHKENLIVQGLQYCQWLWAVVDSFGRDTIRGSSMTGAWKKTAWFCSQVIGRSWFEGGFHRAGALFDELHQGNHGSIWRVSGCQFEVEFWPALMQNDLAILITSSILYYESSASEGEWINRLPLSIRFNLNTALRHIRVLRTGSRVMKRAVL
jgi:hypothetical protein